MSEFLDSNSLLDPNQAGFRQKMSTTSQLLQTYSFYSSQFSQKKPTDAIFFDFQKAFDTIDHRILIDKLWKFGFASNLVKWFENYLYGRSFRVQIGNSLSSSFDIVSGVPQGSCLGPILFILFLDDIRKVIPTSIKYGVYADDLKVYGDAIDQYEDLKSCIENIYHWSLMNNLKLSIGKCAVMHFGTKNPKRSYFLDSMQLEARDKIRDLGITFSPSLSFDQYIDLIAKSAKGMVNFAFRALKTDDEQLLVRAYTCYIRPRLEYATPVWNPTLKKQVNALECVQRYFTRRVFLRSSSPMIAYPDRLKCLNLDTLEKRRALNDLLMIHRTIHGVVHFDFSHTFRLSPSTFHLRNSHSLRIELPYLPGKKFETFASRSLTIWNNLLKIRDGLG